MSRATHGAHTERGRSSTTVGNNHAHCVVGSLELTGSRAGEPPGSNPANLVSCLARSWSSPPTATADALDTHTYDFYSSIDAHPYRIHRGNPKNHQLT